MKSFYFYEYMDDWEKLTETSLPEKERFYSHLDQSLPLKIKGKVNLSSIHTNFVPIELGSCS